MSNLTAEQIDAITHSWLDMSAKLELNNQPFSAMKHAEVDVAMRESIKELESTFSFLLEGVEDGNV